MCIRDRIKKLFFWIKDKKINNIAIIPITIRIPSSEINEKVKVKFNENKFYAFDENEYLVSSPYGVLNG